MAVNAKLLKNWLFSVAAMLLCFGVHAKGPAPLDEIAVARLPIEAQRTLALIKTGGPFPYGKDGAVFGNYEGILPKRKRGYYREFTVTTPGASNRGARRIVAGGELASSGEYYYTHDHYATFKRIRE
jgi:ribonuclease T1